MSVKSWRWTKESIVFECELNNVTVNKQSKKGPIKVDNMYRIEIAPDGTKCRITARFGHLEQAMYHLESLMK